MQDLTPTMLIVRVTQKRYFLNHTGKPCFIALFIHRHCRIHRGPGLFQGSFHPVDLI